MPAMRDRGFVIVNGLVFAASAAATIHACRSMSGDMPMPGGWTMSMAWMRMPGQTWAAAGGAFVAMWLVMMIAMMLPAAALMLSKYRVALRIIGRTRVEGLTAMAAAGYFGVWLAIGVFVYPFGVALAAAAMRWAPAARSVPLACGVVILLAGLLQFTRWKATQLDQCRYSPDCCENPAVDGRGAWLQGMRSGVRCGLCCSGFTAVLLVAGVMNLGVMTGVAAAITVERLAPRPTIFARAAGVVLVLIGARAAALALMAIQ